jgi:hypothetical protein
MMVLGKISHLRLGSLWDIPRKHELYVSNRVKFTRNVVQE